MEAITVQSWLDIVNLIRSLSTIDLIKFVIRWGKHNADDVKQRKNTVHGGNLMAYVSFLSISNSAM